MDKTFRPFLNFLWQSILFWTITMLLMGLFRFFGLDAEPGITVSREFESDFILSNLLPPFALSGVIMGILYATIEFALKDIVPRDVLSG